MKVRLLSSHPKHCRVSDAVKHCCMATIHSSGLRLGSGSGSGLGLGLEEGIRVSVRVRVRAIIRVMGRGRGRVHILLAWGYIVVWPRYIPVA